MTGANGRFVAAVVATGVAAWGCSRSKGARRSDPTAAPASASTARKGVTLSQASPRNDEFVEPPVFASSSGVLDLLLVARLATPSTTPATPAFLPSAWIYEICPRPSASDECPPSPSPINYYGGARLQLAAGDLLRIRLVNRLPAASNAKHASDPGEAYLAMNPTNLHTHGMLVSPHGPTAADPTYGDNVFVLALNPANGTTLPAGSHVHGDVQVDHVDYSIRVPANHPSGLFWFHPHAHGLALNQVSAGLAGIITVGSIADYLSDGGGGSLLSRVDTRHLVLKDVQISAGGALMDQEDPSFCGEPAQPADGSCRGAEGTAFAGGTWFFTVSGQRYPNISITKADGQVWRITNASGSATYDLELRNDVSQAPMPVQVLSLDGVSVSVAGLTVPRASEVAGSRLQPVPCPGASADLLRAPLCASALRMMPSSRAEIWVSYRDARGMVVPAPPGATGVLRSRGFRTGPPGVGDAWPPVNLASFSFSAPTPTAAPRVALSVRAERPSAPSPAARSAVRAEAASGCAALAPGHRRRLFFGVPSSNPDGFGLAHEEVDASGSVIGPAPTDVTPFDPTAPAVCLPLGPDDSPAVERWDLVNLTGEDHNFHVHQVKFRVLNAEELARGSAAPPEGVWLDNLPVPRAVEQVPGGCTIATWNDPRKCAASPVTVEIAFTIPGDFVYHCHILEHEDGGMMARIRVVRR